MKNTTAKRFPLRSFLPHSALCLHRNAIPLLKKVFRRARATYELEAAADGGLDVGAAEGGDLAELTGNLDGVVEEKAQAALVTEACRAGNLSEQDWGAESEADQRHTISKTQKGGSDCVLAPILIPATAFFPFHEPGVGFAS